MAWSSPKTWNVGDVLTAADMNTYVRDNAGYLHGDAGTVDLAAVSLRFGTGGIMRGHRHPYSADRHIESGSVTGVPPYSVSFSDAFGSAPNVVGTVEPGGGFEAVANVSSIGTTGFTLSGSAWFGTGNPGTMHWIAEGAD